MSTHPPYSPQRHNTTREADTKYTQTVVHAGDGYDPGRHIVSPRTDAADAERQAKVRESAEAQKRTVERGQ